MGPVMCGAMHRICCQVLPGSLLAQPAKLDPYDYREAAQWWCNEWNRMEGTQVLLRLEPFLVAIAYCH